MRKIPINPTGEMATWLRKNEHIPEVVPILNAYKKKFKFTNEEYKQAARLRERLELEESGFTAPLKDGIYYKEISDIVYKVNNGGKTAEWRPSSRSWWSKEADLVGLNRDIRNGITVRLTPELASKIGLATGVCCVCGKVLSTQKSMEAGIGPECIKRVKENASQ